MFKVNIPNTVRSKDFLLVLPKSLACFNACTISTVLHGMLAFIMQPQRHNEHPSTFITSSASQVPIVTEVCWSSMLLRTFAPWSWLISKSR